MINAKILIFLILSGIIVGFIGLSSDQTVEEEVQPIIDSEMTFKEAIKGTKAPKSLIKKLRLFDVQYYSSDGKLHQGQLLVHKDVEKDVKEIFELIEKKKFIVEKVIPIVKYDWKDRASMRDNNSSAFCYRYIAGTKRMSNHAYGRAVDINPRWNPYTRRNGTVSPKNGKYDKKRPGTFYEDQFIVKEFKKRGWKWGGNFKSAKDYHHFAKKK